MQQSKGNVLVTGGAGFIGSELVRQLAAVVETVIVVDNFVTGRRENLKGLHGANVDVVDCDIRDREKMSVVMEGVDRIFHLACLGVRHSIHAPVENHDVNATGTLGLLSLAREAGVRRFVYVSSSEVYGTARWTPMTEEHPTYPMTVYGASKLAGECYTRAFYETYGYETVVIRPFNTYGPRCHHEGDSGEVIPKFLLRCMAGKPMVIFGDGTQTRDFTHVSDTAAGILQAGFAPAAAGRTINIGSGQDVSIQILAKEIARTVGSPDAAVMYDAPRPGDVLRLCADTSKARKLLAFQPKMELREGLRALRDWYLSLERPLEDLLEEEVLHNWTGQKNHPATADRIADE